MPRYALSTLKLAPSTHSALKRAGYTTSDDLAGVTAELLCKELGIPLEEAEEVLKPRELVVAVLPGSATAATLLGNGSTFDIVPGLPFLPSSLVELSGTPGSGKTHLALSAILRVIDHGDEVLVADLDGSLPSWRLKRVIRSWEESNDLPADSLSKLLHITSVPDLTSLLSLLLSLPSMLTKMPKLKLVVLDGLSAPFRYPTLLSFQRNHALSVVRDALQRLSAIPVAVIFTTQAATKLVNYGSSLPSTADDSAAQAIVQPALGDTWLSGRFARVMLAREGYDGQRVAYIHRDGRTDRFELEWDTEDAS
ncbi:P-loop containing nucleoside triphosphate hydrolase protein [Calocera cornea HHB12733]|uniref:p-loop containing nucleoside triphosphate hydrolase protein n=1 Tax=Calocera cornea HHB12733 TaxID=1353952 RepID=A0A165FX52_9BASI|nr:P-loop containing nucleoside triphosphate hydrolase protein [Calocera cornea HHB12733]